MKLLEVDGYKWVWYHSKLKGNVSNNSHQFKCHIDGPPPKLMNPSTSLQKRIHQSSTKYFLEMWSWKCSEANVCYFSMLPASFWNAYPNISCILLHPYTRVIIISWIVSINLTKRVEEPLNFKILLWWLISNSKQKSIYLALIYSLSLGGGSFTGWWVLYHSSELTCVTKTSVQTWLCAQNREVQS